MVERSKHKIVFANTPPMSAFLCLALTGHAARCSSVVECPRMVRRVVGPIPHGGPIEVFLVPSSDPQQV